MSTPDIPRLKEKAKQIRRNVLRMASGKGEGYVGQGLGSADILAAIYFHELRTDPKRPDWEDRDRFLLSTGHYSIVLYATLTALGMFPESELENYGADESPFGMSTIEWVPGVEITGGSLGHGLPQAVGMALGAKLKRKNFRVFNFLSDGELQEGSTWEAAMSASHYKLDNLVALVDVNNVQADGPLPSIMMIEPVAGKWEAFGWDAQTLDGNSMEELVGALERARASDGKPKVLVCRTLMGKGVPFIEKREKQHFVRVGACEWDKAKQELEQNG